MLNKILKLERSLGVLDLETTGLNPEGDRIWQISLTLHYPHRDPIAWTSLIDTGILVADWSYKPRFPPKDEMFVGKPTFKQVAPALAPKILNIDICGYNPKDFDIRFMRAEMKRAEIDWPWDGYIIDPLQIYRFKRGHTLTNCYLEYGADDGGPLDQHTDVSGAHDAGFDVFMTEASLRGQLLRYPNLPRTVKELSAYCFPKLENAVDEKGMLVWVGNDIGINFGKHRGKLLKNVDKWYFEYIMRETFPADVKIIIKSALEGIFITKDDTSA